MVNPLTGEWPEEDDPRHRLSIQEALALMVGTTCEAEAVKAGLQATLGKLTAGWSSTEFEERRARVLSREWWTPVFPESEEDGAALMGAGCKPELLELYEAVTSCGGEGRVPLSLVARAYVALATEP
jgi:hypothetical protein